jgi:hypothetical protein
MFPDEKWIIFSITEDDYIEHERCAEQLREIGLDPEANSALVLGCRTCPLIGRCHVTRENVFLGASTC